MRCFLTIFIFLALPFAVKAGFPEGKDGFNIKKLRIIIGCHVKRQAKINVLLDQQGYQLAHLSMELNQIKVFRNLSGIQILFSERS